MADKKRLIDANELSKQIKETAEGLADCNQQNAAWALRKYAIRDIAMPLPWTLWRWCGVRLAVIIEKQRIGMANPTMRATRGLLC